MIVSETLNFDGLAGAISEMDLHNLLQAYPPLEYVYTLQYEMNSQLIFM